MRLTESDLSLSGESESASVCSEAVSGHPREGGASLSQGSELPELLIAQDGQGSLIVALRELRDTHCSPDSSMACLLWGNRLELV